MQLSVRNHNDHAWKMSWGNRWGHSQSGSAGSRSRRVQGARTFDREGSTGHRATSPASGRMPSLKPRRPLAIK
jgi:hypothetical protein